VEKVSYNGGDLLKASVFFHEGALAPTITVSITTPLSPPNTTIHHHGLKQYIVADTSRRGFLVCRRTCVGLEERDDLFVGVLLLLCVQYTTHVFFNPIPFAKRCAKRFPLLV